jgi:carboxylate-amine ligase
MTGNSAIVYGADKGWSSYRYRTLLHWPTFRAPGYWANADRYDRTVQALVDCGAAVGPAGVYLLARLSPRYPTVEVRVADACQ